MSTKEQLDELKQKVAASMGIAPEEIKVVHVSPHYEPGACDHDWPDEPDGRQTDMNGRCTKCGMSFIRYIHTECP